MTTEAVYVEPIAILSTGLLRPISLNDRDHHMVKARRVKAVRHAVAAHARAIDMRPLDHVTVRLHYIPVDNRRRDTDNLWATAKPAIDALVDAGVVPDDTTVFVTRIEPHINQSLPNLRGARLFLHVWAGRVNP